MKHVFLLAIIIIFSVSVSSFGQDIETEISIIENGLLPAVQVKGEAVAKYSLAERMDYYHVPGVSVAIVKDGNIRWAKGYGIANNESETKVDSNTIFQAGSISKPIAALAALMLVEEGLVDLDKDVNEYLTSWKVPENKYTIEGKVTLRLLLTHSAGMTVHGFPGYKQTESFPDDIKVLNGKGNTDPIRVNIIPGTIMRYSGGGYTVMERMVEDISGLSFEEYLEKNILHPIGMTNSTFEQPLPPDWHKNASAAYDSEGYLIEGLWHNYPEQAAAGLWTTPSDLARYCLEIQNIVNGKTDGVLSKTTVESMLSKHLNNWGLGPALKWEADSLIFQHGGKNAGFTNNMMAFVHRGDAVILMTNADNGGELMNEILRSISAYYDWGVKNQSVIETIELSEKDLQRYVGDYQLSGNTATVLINEGVLFASLPGQPKYELIPTDEHIFSFKTLANFKLRFVVKEEGVTAVFFIQPNGTFMGVRK
jgi:CubicO group peptidase (beta-lactamase class C family)